MNSNESNNENLHCEEINELINYRSSWIIRNGIFAFLCLLVLLSFVIKIPQNKRVENFAIIDKNDPLNFVMPQKDKAFKEKISDENLNYEFQGRGIIHISNQDEIKQGQEVTLKFENENKLYKAIVANIQKEKDPKTNYILDINFKMDSSGDEKDFKAFKSNDHLTAKVIIKEQSLFTCLFKDGKKLF
ncbi:MAG: hypothetical protein JNM71_07335 [Flavobacterium lindanitolerans]|uniref:hypothetical protein n=1 Tax=Flavobacterium lindanitolerans TaxID=428988 RepID=UPI001A3CA5DD|nr:hypothetical protein [Flavobacterium lindanitolerans]MBL7867818.1 hypothetical protein [Flavobacterium lindanitolerans]